MFIEVLTIELSYSVIRGTGIGVSPVSLRPAMLCIIMIVDFIWTSSRKSGSYPILNHKKVWIFGLFICAISHPVLIGHPYRANEQLIKYWWVTHLIPFENTELISWYKAHYTTNTLTGCHNWCMMGTTSPKTADTLWRWSRNAEQGVICRQALPSANNTHLFCGLSLQIGYYFSDTHLLYLMRCLVRCGVTGALPLPLWSKRGKMRDLSHHIIKSLPQSIWGGE